MDNCRETWTVWKSSFAPLRVLLVRTNSQRFPIFIRLLILGWLLFRHDDDGCIIILSIFQGCAGSSDGCGGCDPCISQSDLTIPQLAHLHDKPGQDPHQTSCLDICRELPWWLSTTSYKPGWSFGQNAGSDWATSPRIAMSVSQDSQIETRETAMLSKLLPG